MTNDISSCFCCKHQGRAGGAVEDLSMGGEAAPFLDVAFQFSAAMEEAVLLSA